MLKIIKVSGLAIAASLCMAVSALAQSLFDTTPAEGNWYASGFVGVGLPLDAEFDGVQNPVAGIPGAQGAPAIVDADLETDVFFGGAVGRRLGFKFFNILQPRVEVEVSRISSDVQGGTFNDGDQIFGGSQETNFVFLNNYSDVIWEENQAVVPYFGGGIGVAFTDNNITYFPNNGVATAPTFAVQSDDTTVATLSAIGATFNFIEGIEVYSEGRYYRTYGGDAERTFVGAGGNDFSAELDGDIEGFAFVGGIRFKFN